MDERWDFVCGTAHRTLTRPADEPWVREKLAACARWLRKERGTRVVLSGMARGGDLWWADAIARTPGLELWAYIPFAEQTEPWTRADKREWERLVALADARVTVGELPAGLDKKERSAAVNRLLHERNLEMIDMSQAVIAVWETGRLDGGTVGALRVAAKRGMPGAHIDPINRAVHAFLPKVEQLDKYALYHSACGHIAGAGVIAEVEHRRAVLQAAGYHQWRIRRARPRETWTEGCDICRVDPARTAAARGVAA
jgi:hypothetical protein